MKQLGGRIGTLAVPAQQRADSKAMAIIPLTELASLFRQPDYSGNRRRAAAFPGDYASGDASLAE
jgi:hypothetical protein